MNWLLKIFTKKNQERKRLDPKDQSLYQIGREQFLKLKEKGLNIPIFTF